MKNRNRWKNRKGFTLAELLLAVAIIIVLASVAFVGVTRYLRSLHLMEMDNAAKEIFYAAQNRITAELNNGTLGRLDSSAFDTDSSNATSKHAPANTNMVIYNTGVSDLEKTLWDEMLPFGSIDETVRASGSYIITYSYDKGSNMATVLDVWYASDASSGFGRNWNESETTLKGAEYSDLENARINGDRDNRLRFPKGNGPAVVGHYGRGDVNLLDKLYNFKDLDFKLVNDEILYGDFEFKAEDLRSPATDKTMSADSVRSTLEPQLKLTITGVDSKGTLTLRYDTKQHILYRFDSSTPVETDIVKVLNETGTTLSYRFILDNITKDGQRFRDLVGTPDAGAKSFVFGEDIRVNVEVYSNKELANIDSASAVDNSLFQYVKPSTDTGTNTTSAEAGVGKVRHLQNLSSAVSGVGLGLKNTDHTNRLGINSAKQTADLDWTSFTEFKLPNDSAATAIGGNIYYNKNAAEKAHTNDYFYPINLEATNTDAEIPENATYLAYSAAYKTAAGSDPSSHKISNLVVGKNNELDHAGLFGTVKTEDDSSLAEGKHLLTVENLVMEKPTISGKTTAAAVVANEQSAVTLNTVSITDATVKALNGKAGGAVGKAVNGLDLVKVTVTGNSTKVTATNGSAGGLIGEFAGTGSGVHIKIDGSYVGDKDSKEITVKSDGTGAAAAGGLVGQITDGFPEIKNSYSTAWVDGNVAGGLVGTIEKCNEGSLIKYSYVGGHTESGTAKYDKDPDDCNVKGKTVAGGFIGSLGADADTKLSVLFSYTTASASGDQAGGFIGKTAAEVTIANSYAVGLVVDKTPESTPSGAFVGDSTGTLKGNGNNYFELINGDKPAVVGSSHGNSFVQSAESSLQAYNSFVKLGSDNEFFPYDPQLGKMFGTRYFLPTVKDLADLNPDAANAPSTHIGDWQPVDTLVVNTPGA